MSGRVRVGGRNEWVDETGREGGESGWVGG